MMITKYEIEEKDLEKENNENTKKLFDLLGENADRIMSIPNAIYGEPIWTTLTVDEIQPIQYEIRPYITDTSIPF